MRALVQRSLKSFVSIKEKKVGEIEHGLVVFVGFTSFDTLEDIDYIVKKIINLRIFDDENGIMNKSILDVSGAVLSISQFTLYANTKKGNRPSYNEALKASEASKFYELFNKKLSEYVPLQTGVFGEEMLVSIQNDGPVTILLESRGYYERKN